TTLFRSLKKVEDYARVERSWPRPHAQSVKRREPERAVHASEVVHCAETRTAAKVRHDHTAVCDLGRLLAQHGGDVFVGQAVEPVALHASATDLARQRHDLRDLGLSAMETRIETGDLRHARETLGHRIDRTQVVRLMEWGERDQGPQVREDLGRDDRRLRVPSTAVDDTMANAKHPGMTTIPRSEPRGHGVERPT